MKPSTVDKYLILADIVKQIADAACIEAEKHYPGITNKTYNHCDVDSTFHERLQMGVSLELMFAGVLKDNT